VIHRVPTENELKFSVGNDAIGDDAKIIGVGLDEANTEAAPVEKTRPLSVTCRQNDRRELIGGAIGRTWGRCSELQQLWVAAAHRRNGIGRRLVRCFEAAASERGCELVYLDTFSFQAPDFYRKLGYEVAFEIEGFPEAIRKYFMVRRLGQAE
jgi:ribosomal protein S18 acetylase RimI-like enzyme